MIKKISKQEILNFKSNDEYFHMKNEKKIAKSIK